MRGCIGCLGAGNCYHAAPPSSTGYVSINAGGPAVSNASGGDNSFVADEDYSAGGTTYSVPNAITIPANFANTLLPWRCTSRRGKAP